MDWELIAGIFGALDQFENEMNWSLSIGERANLGQALYSELASTDFRLWPQNRRGWERVFEHAFRYTWGKEHNCDAINGEELNLFLHWIFDSIPLTTLEERLSYLKESESCLN